MANEKDSGTSNVVQFPSERRREAGAEHAEDAFLGHPLYENIRSSAERSARVSAEIKAVEARGAGARATNPLNAPSLVPLMSIRKRGRTLHEAILAVLATGKSSGLEFEPWGILQTYSYSDASEELRLAVNLTEISPAMELYEKAGISDWRALVANDAKSLKISGMDMPDNRVYHRVAFARFVVPGRA
jgi:hypothetical protein